MGSAEAAMGLIGQHQIKSIRNAGADEALRLSWTPPTWPELAANHREFNIRELTLKLPQRSILIRIQDSIVALQHQLLEIRQTCNGHADVSPHRKGSTRE
jgi:hypothetical protein